MEAIVIVNVNNERRTGNSSSSSSFSSCLILFSIERERETVVRLVFFLSVLLLLRFDLEEDNAALLPLLSVPVVM